MQNTEDKTADAQQRAATSRMLLPGMFAQSRQRLLPQCSCTGSEITEIFFSLNTLRTSRCLADLRAIRFKRQHDVNI